jgi:NitT/TauT family transport system permease protein
VIAVMAMAMHDLFSLIKKRTMGWAHRGTQGD